FDDTSGLRISSVTSMSSTETKNSSGLSEISRSAPRTCSRTSTGSVTPRLRHSHAIARYMAPVSRYCSPAGAPPPWRCSTSPLRMVRQWLRRSCSSFFLDGGFGDLPSLRQQTDLQLLLDGRDHGHIDDAELPAGGVLHAEVLDVDVEVADVLEQLGQDTGPGRDQDRDNSIGGRRLSVLAGDPVVSLVAQGDRLRQQSGRAGTEFERPDDLVEFGPQSLEHGPDLLGVPGQDLRPQARIA